MKVSQLILPLAQKRSDDMPSLVNRESIISPVLSFADTTKVIKTNITLHFNGFPAFHLLWVPRFSIYEIYEKNAV